MGTPYKRCPRCHAPAHLETEACYQCGHRYRTRFIPNADQTQAYGLQDQPGESIRLQDNAPPRPLLVAMMWMAVLVSATIWRVSIDVAAGVNLVAVVLALFLVASRSRADRASGSIMLLLQFIAVAIFCWFQFKGK